MAELVWMRHEATGGVQALPVGAVEQWRLLGWTECDAPVEADPAMVEHVPTPIPVPVEVDVDDNDSPEED
jgi:hypothetical protein